MVEWVLGLRFLVFYLRSRGASIVQSLILTAILVIVGFQVGLVGLIRIRGAEPARRWRKPHTACVASSKTRIHGMASERDVAAAVR